MQFSGPIFLIPAAAFFSDTNIKLYIKFLRLFELLKYRLIIQYEHPYQSLRWQHKHSPH